MSLTCKFFSLVESEIKPISKRAMDCFYNGDKAFPEYANQKVKYIEVLVELENRKPVRIVHLIGSMLSVGAHGEMDQAFHHESLKLAVNSLSPAAEVLVEENGVLDASAVFKEKMLKNQHRWTPSNIAVNQIAEYLGV